MLSDNKLWFQPECTGSGSDGQVGPSPRAFHVAVSIDCNMFIFGGRYGSKRYIPVHKLLHSQLFDLLLTFIYLMMLSDNFSRLSDFWVLDTGKNIINASNKA